MTEYEISNCIDQIQSICEQLNCDNERAKQQGRMPTLAEARQMDKLSFALIEEIRKLPPNACSLLENKDQKHRVKAVMASVRTMLEQVAQPALFSSSKEKQLPQAASRRMEAYGIC
jgi:cobalamin biosynthesis protein CbiD